MLKNVREKTLFLNERGTVGKGWRETLALALLRMVTGMRRMAGE